MRLRHHLVVRAVPIAVVLITLGLVAVGCRSGTEVVDFGEPPPEGAPAVPADGGVDVADAPQAEPPPADARLEPGGWPEAAAFVAREAADGRPTLVNIFASWCGPCEREIPLLLETRDANPDVAFLGIDHLDRLEDAEVFVEEMGIDIPTIHDLDGDVAFAVGGRGMPTTVIFDRDGRLAGRVVGELTAASLDDLLAAVS